MAAFSEPLTLEHEELTALTKFLGRTLNRQADYDHVDQFCGNHGVDLAYRDPSGLSADRWSSLVRLCATADHISVLLNGCYDRLNHSKHLSEFLKIIEPALVRAIQPTSDKLISNIQTLKQVGKKLFGAREPSEWVDQLTSAKTALTEILDLFDGPLLWQRLVPSIDTVAAERIRSEIIETVIETAGAVDQCSGLIGAGTYGGRGSLARDTPGDPVLEARRRAVAIDARTDLLLRLRRVQGLLGRHVPLPFGP